MSFGAGNLVEMKIADLLAMPDLEDVELEITQMPDPAWPAELSEFPDEPS